MNSRNLAAGVLIMASIAACADGISAADSVYFSHFRPSTSTYTVRQMGLDGSSQNILYSLTSQSVRGLAIDPSNNMIYWGNGASIMVSALTGGGTPTVLQTFGSFPHSVDTLRIDVSTQTLYWSDQLYDDIWSYTIGGPPPTKIVHINGTLRDFALDLRAGKEHIYAIDNLYLYRADLNGGNLTTINAIGNSGMWGIAIDPCDDRIYYTGETSSWSTGTSPWIRSANLSDGGNIKVVASSGIGKAFRIAVDPKERMIYWTAENKVLRAKMDGSGIQEIFTGVSLDVVRDIDLELADLTCPMLCPSCALEIPPCGTWPQTRWLSLPSAPHYFSGGTYLPIEKAEDLCSAIGTATKVSKAFPSRTNQYTWECGGTSSSSCSSTSSSTIPETGCGTNCFCIHPGEGYEIEASGPANVQIYGKDTPVGITLPGGMLVSLNDGLLVSVPCQASISTAEDYMVYLGIGAGQGDITRRSGCGIADFLVHPAGNTLVSNFQLVAGEAVRIRKYSVGDINYTSPVDPAPSFPPQMANPLKRTYCISGTSNFTGWSWWIDLGDNANGAGMEPSNAAAGPLTSGSTASAFASYFIGDINGVCPGIAAQDSSADCFSITAPNSFGLWVGPSGDPSAAPALCNPVSTGLGTTGGGTSCTFNPQIWENVPFVVPAIGPVGLGVLIGCLGLVAVLFLKVLRLDRSGGA